MARAKAETMTAALGKRPGGPVQTGVVQHNYLKPS